MARKNEGCRCCGCSGRDLRADRGPRGALDVSQVINYYTGGTLVTKGPGFRRTFPNVNLSAAPDINHLNVEKNPRLHASVISRIQAIVGSRHAGPAAARSVAQ